MQPEKCEDRFPYSCALPLGLATWQPIGCTGPQAWMKRKFSQSLGRLQEEDTQKCRLQAQRQRNARSLGHHQSWWTNYFRRQLQAGLCRGVLIYELGNPAVNISTNILGRKTHKRQHTIKHENWQRSGSVGGLSVTAGLQSSPRRLTPVWTGRHKGLETDTREWCTCDYNIQNNSSESA